MLSMRVDRMISKIVIVLEACFLTGEGFLVEFEGFTID